jgi:multidrug resistance efflux pump
VPAPFSRSMRSLATDGPRGARRALLITAILIGAWLAWFLGASVGVYEVAEVARVEVDRIAHRVDAPITGKLVSVNLGLGRDVAAGDVLVELDARELDLELSERQARAAALSAEIEPAKRQLAAADSTLRAHGNVTRAQIGEARARHREATEQAELARVEAQRGERLFQEGLASEADRARATSQEKTRRASAAATEQAVGRVGAEGRAQGSGLEGEIARLGREIAKLEGDRLIEEKIIEKIAYERERRKVRAPIAGRIGEITVLQAGSVLHQGDPIAVIVPRGEFRLVATFSAATAIGRVRPGQRGRLRLTGFPWEQYGTLWATVVGVASESHDGHLRVELDVERDPGSLIPLQHGLSGTVEVEVERVSPAILVLRAAGRLLRRNATADEPAQETRS